MGGGWINTGLHAAAWKGVKEEGKYKSAEWVMKLDADAVFVPSRLRPILAKQMVPAEGVYLENCQHVSYGYFGNLEVFSLAAFETLVTNIDTCKASLPWKTQACIQTQPIMNPILKDAAPVTTSLYCFSTYMAETGQTKKSVDELGNLQLQYKRDIGIFQCDFWQVFTEGDAELAPGVPFVKVFDTDGDFHFAKRKETGGWINTGLHAAAWKAVKEEGKYKSAEWVMKLDAGAQLGAVQS